MSDGPAQHVVLEPFRERRHPAEQLDALSARGRPAWFDADAVAATHLPSVRAAFGHLEVALLVDDVLTAAAWGISVRWDGTVADLPGGHGDSPARSLERAEPWEGPPLPSRSPRKGWQATAAGMTESPCSSHDLGGVVTGGGGRQ